MYLPGVPPEYARQIIEALRRPEGTLEFLYRFEGIFDPNLGSGVLLEVATGAMLFRLERDEKLNTHFIHSSPGTGTRIASVNLNPLCGATALTIALVWSPTETRLHVIDADNPTRAVAGVGRPSPRQFRVGDDRRVYQVGDEGLKVMGVRMFLGGKPVLQPTAIEAWTDTVEAVRLLLKGSSPDGYVFEMICANLSIVMLVTGFEAYCRRRLLELEGEGIPADFDALARSFLTKYERENDLAAVIRQQAAAEGISPLAKLVDSRRGDFQNFDRCKTAYAKAYGISFGRDLGVSNTTIEQVRRAIRFRHRIVHTSPLIGMLNQDRVPPEEPVFPSFKLVEETLTVFDSFIQALHAATLRLRPEAPKGAPKT